MTKFYDAVSNRLIKYAKINSQSKFNTNLIVSTPYQYDMAQTLYDELVYLNVQSYFDKDHCIVYGKINKNTKEGTPFALITHIDTAPDAPGNNVKPWILKNYDGKDIVLNKEKNIIMSPNEFKNLLNYVGSDLILTDGTTLLGGDDKAGIAAVMTLVEYIMKNPSIKHNTIEVIFTPDEEVGGLAKDLDLNRLESKFAYTLDGDHLGNYSFETFNALEALINIKGLSVHTGTAKGIMINALTLASNLLQSLPQHERPEYTSCKEGFYHPIELVGNCENAKLRINIRDFDIDEFNNKKDLICRLVANINLKYGNIATLEFRNGYPNMSKYILEKPYIINNLVKAIRDSGNLAIELPFRGGTDGAALSRRGLPCPNLSSGYENAHGRFEYVPIQNMEQNVLILLQLVGIYSK